MNYVELIGVGASVFVLVSMLFRQVTHKERILMRIFNTVGSLVFVIYGIILPAYATAVFNFMAVLVNVNALYREYLREKNRKDIRRNDENM